MIAMEEKAAREAVAVKAAKEAEALRKQIRSITSFGDGSAIHGESAPGAKGALSSVLTTLGPLDCCHGWRCCIGHHCGVAFEAAKSLGEYGTRVKDAELRTG